MRVYFGRLFYLTFCMLLGFPVVSALGDTVKLERLEVIQESELIFGGQVISKTHRWNERGNLIVTDYEFSVDQVFKGSYEGQTIQLTFAGGELDGETHWVSDVPTFEVDQVVVLMLESVSKPLFSPVTGAFQGKFTLENLGGPGGSIMVDGSGQPVVDSSGNALNLQQFSNMLVEEVARAQTLPPRDRSIPEYLQAFILNDLPELPYDAEASGRSTQAAQQQGTSPRSAPESETPFSVEKIRLSGEQDKTKELSKESSRPEEMWSYSNRAKNVPIVYNPWPDSFPEWCRFHDQYALSRWNVYCNIYQVMAATGNWAWQNNRYDMCGFPSNQTMIDQFAQGWGANTLAICWKRWDSTGFSIEADIAVNPAFSWTTTPFAAYSNTNIHYLPQTMTHEVGHSWGLDHQFNAMSTMNYFPHRFRSYDVLFMDDILAVRAAFPGNVVNRTDTGVYLFNTNGFQSATESTVSPTSVQTGTNVDIGNIVIENIGTNAISPTLDWYLVPNIGSWSGAYYVGSTTHANLNSGQWFLTSRTLTIPAGIPNGAYYFAAFVTNANDSVGNNNSSWLSRQVFVQNPTPPSNDNWSDTISVPPPYPKTVFGTNVAATSQTAEQHLNPAQATVWWYVRAPANGTFTIDTFGSNFDTMLHVYTGYQNGFANLSLVASNDDTSGLQSRVDFPALAGEYYEVRVAGYLGDSGNIVLNVNFEAAVSEISSAFAFYSGSPLDNGNLGNALDNSKVVALQTQTPQPLSFDNVINSSRGITGLVFDVQDLPASTLTAGDFAFQMSPPGAFDQSSHPTSNWQAAPNPSSISVLAGTPKRVVLRWPDNSIVNRWLRVTLRSNANTGLPEDQVYYLGHLLGETTGLTGNSYTVAFADISPIRSGIGTSVTASSGIDIDKNGTVAFADITAMRGNIGAQLTNVTVP